MKYEELKTLPPEDFRRFCGVKPETFAAMLLALQEDYQKKHRRGGRETHISLEDKLLITMTYYREYRTQFHIAAEFGTTESNRPLSKPGKGIRFLEFASLPPPRPSPHGEGAVLRQIQIATAVSHMDSYETVAIFAANESPPPVGEG